MWKKISPTLRRSPSPPLYDERKSYIIGVMCRKCHITLPPHTLEQHLDIDYIKTLHTCVVKKSIATQTDFEEKIDEEGEMFFTNKKDVEGDIELIKYLIDLTQKN